MARICIIGSGAVGTAAGIGFKELGSEVVFYDFDRARIQTLSDLNLNATTDLLLDSHQDLSLKETRKRSGV